ncbi:MAG TPA: histidine kinase [Flavisolibacter sp.]|nr:histidine kinase [Flavisolibacter sp.]
MKTKRQRYSFWKVFWVILAVNVLFSLIGIIALSLAPVSNDSVNIHSVFSWKGILRQVVSFLFSIAFFYYTLNAYYRLFLLRKNYVPFLQVSIVAVVACISYHAVVNYFFPATSSMNGKEEVLTTGLLVFSFAFASLLYTGISLLVAYLTILQDEKKQRKILLAQKMKLEVEKSQANFNFLKAQINPHFLHNTLNFLYAKSLPYSSELSEGILTLSEIMRYALSEGNTKDGKTLLKDEIEHVRNVIKINQLRFSNNLNVQFEVNGVINGATIIPFVLITIVENAFKHGDLKSPEHPIEIRLNVDTHHICFYCRNKKKTGPKELSTGLGLDNIKKRLDLAYGRNYTLNVKDEHEFYTTELIIHTS